MADINSGEMTKLEFKAIDPAANAGPVLSYTATNDRGWNDPPSFVFSPNTGNRKKIDLRKRVAHDISSAGNGYGISTQSFQPIQSQLQKQAAIPQPAVQLQPTVQLSHHYQPSPQPNMNGMAQTFNNMILSTPSTPQPMMNHASSNPDMYQAPFMNPLHHSASVPNRMNSTGQNRIPGHGPGTMTPPPSGANTPPVQTRSGSATPPFVPNSHSPNRKLSVPSIPYASSIFDQHSTPTMLQSSHLPSSKTQENGMYQNQPVVNTYGMANGHQQIPIYSPPTTQQVTNQLFAPSGPGSFSPIPNTDPNNHGMFGLPNSNLTPTGRKTSPINAPPPIAGYYARRVSNGYSSPAKVSPAHSGQSSPIPSIDSSLLENDKEVLVNTLKRLNNCREQCSYKMTSKASEDINKKIKVFESQWASGKLSAPTKGKMVQLSDALSQRDYMQSDLLHKSLLHEHSNEVSSWLVAIKKLMSCYQGNDVPTQ